MSREICGRLRLLTHRRNHSSYPSRASVRSGRRKLGGPPQIGLQALDLGGIPQIEHHLLLNLPDAVSRQTEGLAHFFQGVLIAVKTEAYTDDLFLSQRNGFQSQGYALPHFAT